MDRYTTEAYPCVVAETYATASQNLELVVQTIDLALRVYMVCTQGEMTQAYHHAKVVERALLPPGPSGKCCWQYLHSFNKNETAMSVGRLTFS